MKVLCTSALIVLYATSAFGQLSARSNAGPLPALNGEATARVGKSRTLTLDIEFTDPSGDGFLDARETSRLRIIISNNGSFPVRGASVKIVPKTDIKGITFIDSIKVGDIPVNGTRYAIFYFTAGSNVPSQTVTCVVNVVDGAGELAADPRMLTFVSREARTR
jgi:hypothetical protein